jgi:hypothetical protein
MRVVNPDRSWFLAAGLALLLGCPSEPAPGRGEAHRCHLVRRIPQHPRLVKLEGEALKEVGKCADVRCSFRTSGAWIHPEGDKLRIVADAWPEQSRTAPYERRPLMGDEAFGIYERGELVITDLALRKVVRVTPPKAELRGLARWDDGLFGVEPREDGPARLHPLVPGRTPLTVDDIPLGTLGDLYAVARLIPGGVRVAWLDGTKTEVKVPGRIRGGSAAGDTAWISVFRPRQLITLKRGAPPTVTPLTREVSTAIVGGVALSYAPLLGIARVGATGETGFLGAERDLRGAPFPVGRRRTTMRVAQREGDVFVVEEIQDETCQIRSRLYRGLDLSPVTEVDGALILPHVQRDGFRAVHVDISLQPLGD